MNTSQIHEIVSFSFKAGVDIEVQKKHLVRLGAFANAQSGFVSRQSYFDAQAGRWLDHVVWLDPESAKAAMKSSLSHTELVSVMADISQADLSVGHYERVL